MLIRYLLLLGMLVVAAMLAVWLGFTLWTLGSDPERPPEGGPLERSALELYERKQVEACRRAESEAESDPHARPAQRREISQACDALADEYRRKYGRSP